MKLVKKELIEQSFERYDIEVKNNSNFVANGIVVHNCNSRFVYLDGQFHCGSRELWRSEFQNTDHITLEYLLAHNVEEEQAKGIIERIKRGEKKTNDFWRTLRADEGMQNLLKDNEGVVLYGEIYGWIQNLRYGHGPQQTSFAAFDAMKGSVWLEPEELLFLCGKYGVNTAHSFNTVRLNSELIEKDFYELKSVTIEPIPFDFDKLCEMAEGNTYMGKNDKPQIREGIVVQPIKNRAHESVGRVKLKIVSGAYLEKSK